MFASLATPVNLHSLSSFDWFLLAVVIASALLAFRKGLIRVLFSIAGLVVGAFLAAWYYEPVGLWMHRWIANEETAHILAFPLILFLVWLAFTTAAAFVRKAAKAVGLGFADRTLGALFGVLRGALLCIAALLAMAAFAPDSSLGRTSVLSPYFLAGADTVTFAVPQGLRDQVVDGTGRLLGRSSTKKLSGALKTDRPTK